MNDHANINVRVNRSTLEGVRALSTYLTDRDGRRWTQDQIVTEALALMANVVLREQRP